MSFAPRSMKEEDIRPRKIFDEYLRLAERDTETYFSGVERVASNCPACDSKGREAFHKFGFAYEICPFCQTLYVNPRPVAGAFMKYYIESPSAEYWASTFYKETAEARKYLLWEPKSRLLLDTLERHSAIGYTLIDIGGGYGLFAEAISKIIGRLPIVIEPSPHLAASCRERSLPVVEKFLEDVVSEDLPTCHKVFVSFELFEHLHDPGKFLQHLKTLMGSGDLFVFTTLSGLGVDIQALWQDSKSVSPPHHLNFFNPTSIGLFLKRFEFQNIEITTPGSLDIDILANNQELIKDRFWRSFITTATDEQKQHWQNLISTSGWSSHMMVVCKKQ